MDSNEPNPHELVSGVVKLASLPGVYFEVKRLVDDPRATMQGLGRVIARDPALTTRLLRIANSAFFGFAAKIETVSRAVAILGFQQIHDLALATSVTSAFEGIAPDLMDMERFWRNCVYCGVVARVLAARCNVLDSERLFVEGLLRDLGHLILYDRLPGPAAEALARARAEGLPLFRMEREVIGFDYAQLGAILMREWHLPPSLQESVHRHPEPAKAQDFPLETAIVHIAGLVTEAVDAGTPVAEWSLPVERIAWQVTGLSEADLESVKQESDRSASETIELFFPKAKATV